MILKNLYNVAENKYLINNMHAELLKSCDVLGLSLGNMDFQLPPQILRLIEVWRRYRSSTFLSKQWGLP